MENNNKRMDIEVLLAQLEITAPRHHEIVQSIRQIFHNILPKIRESVMYGGIVFFLNEDLVAGIFARTHHVSLEFGHGHMMKDPGQHLKGKGKYRRHLKIRTIDEVTEKSVVFYIQQIPLD